MTSLAGEGARMPPRGGAASAKPALIPFAFICVCICALVLGSDILPRSTGACACTSPGDGARAPKPTGDSARAAPNPQATPRARLNRARGAHRHTPLWRAPHTRCEPGHRTGAAPHRTRTAQRKRRGEPEWRRGSDGAHGEPRARVVRRERGRRRGRAGCGGDDDERRAGRGGRGRRRAARTAG